MMFLHLRLPDRVKLVIGPSPMMTALNMNGFSLSLIRLDAEREAALASPVDPHAWVPPVMRHGMNILPAPKVAGWRDRCRGQPRSAGGRSW